MAYQSLYRRYRSQRFSEVLGQPHVTDTLVLVNGTENRRIACAGGPLPYFSRLIADVRDRTETAMAQTHAFRVMEIAIQAQMAAEA